MESFLNKKVNLIFAVYVALMPIMASLLDLFKVDFSMLVQMLLWTVVYGIFIVVSISSFFIYRKKISFSLKKLFKNYYFIVVSLMFLLILISTVINGAINSHLVVYASYLFLFICFFNLEKKHQLFIINLLIGVVAVSCVMGFIDPTANFMPGFDRDAYPFSLQFYNPNYSGYVVVMLAIAVSYFLNNETKVLNIVLYSLSYLIFGYFLFLNGSFFPIATIFIIELFMLIFLSIKKKKFQYRILIMFLILVPLCFLSDIYPNIENIRTCKYNFFVECVAVFDNIFKTNLLQSVVGVESVAGADGWDRGTLLSNALKYVFSSPKNILVGGGSGKFYSERPHFMAVALMMDFGIFMPILFSCIVGKFFLDCIKLPFNHCLFVSVMVCVGFLICMCGGAHTCYYSYIFLLFFAYGFKEILSNEKENLIKGSEKVEIIHPIEETKNEELNKKAMPKK